MAKTTGPILTAGAITVGNRVILNGQTIDWRVPVATGVAAGMLSLFEKAMPKTAVAFSWAVLLTILVTRIDPKVASPAESFVAWWEGK